MIEIIKNKNNLSELEINNIVTRVKALIINSNNQILLGHSYCEYQFPGGHVENNEEFVDALKRELKEETGLTYDVDNITPFVLLKRYYKEYPTKNENTKIIIYYYIIKSDEIPNLSNTNLTDEEKDGNFKLRYVPLDIVEDVLKENIESCGDAQGIAEEMLEVLKIYFQNV